MKAMNLEPRTEEKKSLFHKFLQADAQDSSSYRNQLFKELELIAAKKGLSIDQLKLEAEHSIKFDEDLSRSQKIFTIISSL